MKRSKQVGTVLLLASLAPFLAGCGDADDATEGMKFGSYEECSLNIGADNCKKDPVQTQVAGPSGGSSSTFMPIFLPMPGYSGGYLHDAPRNSSSYRPSNPVFAASPRAMPSSPSYTGAARSSSSFSGSTNSSSGGSSSVARGGFGSTSASFGSSSS